MLPMSKQKTKNNSRPVNGNTSKAKSQNSYRSDMKTAYGKGYVKGWDDAYDIPKRTGARHAAALGYSKGVRNHRKADKYVSTYNKNKSKQN